MINLLTLQKVKKHLYQYFVVALLLLSSFQAAAQMKIYTRGVKIKDFTSKTTKVVLGGPQVFADALREEVSSLWSVSPYEFCTEGDYEKLKGSNDYYFLHLCPRDSVMFLTLDKGGKEGETNPLLQGFNLADIPVFSQGDPSPSSVEYMAAFVDMMQNFIEAALRSEPVAYKGLKGSVQPKRRGANPVTLDISPLSSSGPRYRLVFDADTHVLYSYGRFSR